MISVQDLRRPGSNDAHHGNFLLLFLPLFARHMLISQKQLFVRLELEEQVRDVHAEEQERGAA